MDKESDLGIPQRRKTPDHPPVPRQKLFLIDDDEKFLDSAANILQDSIGKYLSAQNTKAKRDIDSIITKRDVNKKNFFNESTKTYKALKKFIENCFTKKKNLYVGIKGDKAAYYKWGNYNPGKMCAINLIFSELEKLLYKPVNLGADITGHDSDDGRPYGGYHLVIYCNLGFEETFEQKYKQKNKERFEILP